MKYLCLVYFDGKVLDNMSETEKNAFDNESLACDEELQRIGHFIAAEALESVKSAFTVRIRSGKISTTDGPFTETKEQLGGFILIEARDLNDAIQVAAKIPLARFGGIEVRPIWELEKK